MLSLLVYHRYPACIPSILLSFLIIQRPPISTLFPYTTLFRSVRLHLSWQLDPSSAGRRRQLRRCVSNPPCNVRRRLDRKSTRLNSSHRCISYAVFCLKKKTQGR